MSSVVQKARSGKQHNVLFLVIEPNSERFRIHKIMNKSASSKKQLVLFYKQAQKNGALLSQIVSPFNTFSKVCIENHSREGRQKLISFNNWALIAWVEWSGV